MILRRLIPPKILRAETDLTAMNRLRSQILGLIILAAFLLLLACIRYYFKLG
jgi:hypothetical protein